MRTEDFDFDLPDGLVAQEPAEPRDASRLLVLEGSGDTPTHHRFHELPELLRAGDLLVINDARVLPARLYARRPTGGRIELLLLAPIVESPPRWRALVRPGRRAPVGERLAIGEEIEVRVVEVEPGGTRVLEFDAGVDVVRLLDRLGTMPLPPYIDPPRTPERRRLDRRRYQTVYATTSGAVAAPTAGLHFTPELLTRLVDAGVGVARLTLHVGLGTFRPITSESIEEHVMESERYSIPADTVAAIHATRRAGGRIVAVGTTVVRSLEHAARIRDPNAIRDPTTIRDPTSVRDPATIRYTAAPRDGVADHSSDVEDGTADLFIDAGGGAADLFVTPGFRFRVVDAMITNFHLPRSTPLLLLAALVGRKRLLATYRAAVEHGYRFYSYGDAMLVLP